MSLRVLKSAGLACAILLSAFGSARAETPSAEAIIEATGVQGGFIVHLGCGDGELTAALRVNERYQVHGLSRDAALVNAARQAIRAKGSYGDVSVDLLQGETLPYIDQLVNLIVAEDLQGISMEEVLRVLAPRGVAYVLTDGQWKKTTKPWPTNIDEWTHFLHDSGGNAVAHDDVVGPPRHLQWLGNPRWSRHHDRMASMSALVSAKGRIFYVMDEGSRISIELPPKWTLIARDAFNGVILWKKPIKSWHSHLYPLKSGPTQLARRLVASGDRVYITLGLEEPVTILDAATGKELHTLTNTGSTEEVIESGGDLFVLVNPEKNELADFKPEFNTGDQKRVREGTEFHWNKQPREIMAVNSESGQKLWTKKTVMAPLSLTANDKHVVFHDGEKVVCLDRKTGEELWSSSPVKHKDNVTTNFGPRLILHKDVVLFAGGDGNMYGFNNKTGETLWTAPHSRSGYQSPEDLMVAGGLVWNSPNTSTGDTGVLTGRDPKTGEVKVEFPPDENTYWFHHRCYISKATDKFIMSSRTGVEFVDLKKKDWEIHHWVRGGCLYGVMPANGLLYTPPNDCFCYPEAKLFGFNALAPASPSRDLPKEISEADRLERGPAFEKAVKNHGADAPRSPDSGDWPTYRHDASRSSKTATLVSANLQTGWKTKLGGRLSPVSIANGKLYVAQVDAHTLHCLDEKTGKPIWSYTTGGRIDTPPTIFEGRAIFGSADGYAYSVTADTGELIWRYRGAPRDQRLFSLEQLESVWPVHGTILVRDGIAWFIAGRSNYLDGGLRLLRLDAKTGQKVSEHKIDDKDPATGLNIQTLLQTLQMPTGLTDVLSSDDKYVFMRSQRFNLEGEREEISPKSGDAARQGGTQRGPGVHLFSPTGFLDDTYFHRSYWVFGRSFAGGHNGYYQAGKYAPAGRLLAFDESNVYGFGRKPEYLKWTTTMEHQLFATSKEPPVPPVTPAIRRGRAANNANPAGAAGSSVNIPNAPSLDPTNKAITVEAWINAERPNGVIVSRGGPQNGYALVIQQGKPAFVVRSEGKISTAQAATQTVGKWVHVVGTLGEDKKLNLYVNGKPAANATVEKLIPTEPKQTTQIGADENGAVGEYQSPLPFAGVIDEVRIYQAALSAEDASKRFADRGAIVASSELVLSYTFDNGKAEDASGQRNEGTITGTTAIAGRFEQGLKFTGQARVGAGNAANNQQVQGSLVVNYWNRDVPLIAQGIAIADKTLFVMGPPDVLDEEVAFERLRAGDPRIQETLAHQDASFSGERGAKLMAFNVQDGKTLSELTLDALPVWDGLAVANGRLYIANINGEVVCLTPSE